MCLLRGLCSGLIHQWCINNTTCPTAWFEPPPEHESWQWSSRVKGLKRNQTETKYEPFHHPSFFLNPSPCLPKDVEKWVGQGVGWEELGDWDWHILSFSCSVVSNSLRPHGLQHTRLLSPPLSPLSQWCHLTISSSVAPFSFCLHSFPASGSFPMSWLFTSGDKSTYIHACVCTRECTHMCTLSLVQLFSTPRTIARQAPQSMGFPRQEYWRGLLFPPPGDLPDPVIEPTSPALTGRFFTTEPPGKPYVAVGVQALNCVRLFVSPWTTTCQTSLSFTISWICSDSCPLSQWCPPALSYSVIPFSSCLQYFPASVSFPMSQPFASSDQSIRASASASVFPINIQGWFPLGLTGLISLLSKGLSRVFSSSTVWKYQLLSTHICLYVHVYMCTLFILGAKWITNENLLYSTGNFTPFSVVTQMGRKS